MSAISFRVPSYCIHTARNQAYVRLNGEMIYLGPPNSPESREKYDRLIAEWMQAGRVYVKPADKPAISVNEILLAYRQYADTYYVSADGTSSPEIERINLALRPVMELYGTSAAAEFGPRALTAVQEKMVSNGLGIRTINQRVVCIKRAFRWAVRQELVPPFIYHGLQTVEGLRQGRSKAKPVKPVRPVPESVVTAVLKHLPPTLQAMVKIHELTGMRSGELVIMRGVDIEIHDGGQSWFYRPQKHKSERHGHQRVISIGPRTQELLKPFFKPDLSEFLFSPLTARAERNAKKRAKRKSPVQPSQLSRSKRVLKKRLGNRYSTASYRRALEYATSMAIRAGDLPAETRWHPHQLRHNAATRIRRQFGLDGVRAALGHRSVVQSAEYAELDLNLAASAASALG